MSHHADARRVCMLWRAPTNNPPASDHPPLSTNHMSKCSAALSSAHRSSVLWCVQARRRPGSRITSAACASSGVGGSSSSELSPTRLGGQHHALDAMQPTPPLAPRHIGRTFHDADDLLELSGGDGAI